MEYFYDYVYSAMSVPLSDNVLFKLALSAIFGLIIGLDRELKKKPLGLKTCLVLSVSSCLLTIVSIESSYTLQMTDSMRVDPLRLAAQIVSGVGFIGAGVILKRSNEAILGLTTAAMIWGASGIGIAVGAGYYIEASFALLVILFGVDIIPMVLRKVGPKALHLRELDVIVTVNERQSEDDSLETTLSQFNEKNITIKTLKIRSTDEHYLQIQMRIEIDSKYSVTEVFRMIQHMDGVKDVDLRSF